MDPLISRFGFHLKTHVISLTQTPHTAVPAPMCGKFLFRRDDRPFNDAV
jgi:hypothetical protein